ncbi:site-specific integrase [Paraburkholderia dinghuensis]|uniref:Site-specific integrase n=1 Tax=Paraburkholderia dinghuensis TaxID=2305225 RepID=A0A3N6MV46_9BURK|nr:site-specific integrase [Paraburkholderia dinghuensis]RQH00192.1 site-specific integrase [Paraburkholderia dinghuensis]
MAGIWRRGKYWRAEVRRTPHPLQTSTFNTKAEAEAWARQIESEMDRGVFVNRKEAKITSFDELLKRYAKEVSPKKKGGDGEIIRILKLRKDKLAAYKVAELTSKVMSDYRDRRLAGDSENKPVTGSTVNRELTLIRHVLTVAVKDWGIPIEGNPVSGMRRPKENRARTRRLSSDEEKWLLAELTPSPRDENGRFGPGGCRNEWVLPVVVVAIETAMRRSEILALRWVDVFLDDRYVRLLDSKNGEARDVPLSTKAAATLSALPRDPSGHVFPITGEALKKAFTRACERAGIENLHFHDLRHEATSRLATRLDNILELSAVTGHKTVQMLKRYYHPRASDLARKLG